MRSAAAAVRRILAPHVPVRGTVAVSRANHPGRYGALLLTHEGGSSAYAKVALDDPGVETLEREIVRSCPSEGLLTARCGLLACWRGIGAPRAGGSEHAQFPRPWAMTEEVAAALGTFFKAGSEEVGGAVRGPAETSRRGTYFPPRGWVLVDWESAGEQALPFHDLCHFLVQSHALLGQPTSPELLEVPGRTRWIAG